LGLCGLLLIRKPFLLEVAADLGKDHVPSPSVIYGNNVSVCYLYREEVFNKIKLNRKQRDKILYIE
jgi:hypothetical protein